MSQHPARNSTTRRQYRAIAKQHLATNGGLCWLCHQPINPNLKYPHPMSLVADHTTPLALGGNPLNVQPAHKHCNEKRGTNAPPLNNTTKPW